MNADSRTFAGEQAGWIDHPLRARVLGEVHARPFRRFEAPQVILHYAFHTPSDAVRQDREFFAQWCLSEGAAAPDFQSRVHQLAILGGSLRWEQHSEFVSYTFDTEPAPGATAFSAPAQDPFGSRFRPPGSLMAATQVEVLPAEGDIAAALALLDEASLSCSRVLEGKAFVATDFRPDRDGKVRILVQDRGLSPRRLGSLVQSLLEIETYRIFALLGLPRAMDQTPLIRSIEKRSVSVVDNIRNARGLNDNRNLLDHLFALAAEVEASVAASSFRFGASRAYMEIVEDRLAALGEEPVESWPTIATFLNRRLLPAMRTCRAVEQRQRDLSDKMARLANLLRTRVEVELEEQNGELLHSMNQRVKQQLLLQQTVEGLSVAAVSYYIIGIVGYLLKGVTFFNHEIEPLYLTAACVPPVVASVWWTVHGIRTKHGG